MSPPTRLSTRLPLSWRARSLAWLGALATLLLAAPSPLGAQPAATEAEPALAHDDATPDAAPDAASPPPATPAKPTAADVQAAQTAAQAPQAASQAASQAAPQALTVAPLDQADARRPSGFVWRARLAQQAAGQSVAEALERAPGAYVRRQSSYGQPAFLQVRGSTPRQVMVLIQGLRVRSPVGLGFDVGSLSSAGLSTLALYRGPVAGLYGAGALYGALDIELGPSRERPLGASWRGMIGAGSFDTAEAALQLQLSEAARAVRADVSWRQSQGDFPFIDDEGAQDRRVNNDHSHLQVALSAVERHDRDRWEIVTLVDALEAGVAGPAEFQRSLGLARQRQRRGMVAARWTRVNLWSGDWGVVDLTRGVGIQWREQDYTNPRAILGQGRFQSESLSVGVDSWTETRLYVGDHALVTRVETQRQQHRASSTQEDAAAPLDALRQGGALAISDEWTLGAWSLLGSLRGDLLHDRGPEGMPSSTTLPITPALGALWRAHEAVSARANLARTVRPPDFDELYLEAETLRGDPTLLAERAWSADVGLDLTRVDPVSQARSLWAQLVLFGAQSERQLLFVPRTAYLIQATDVGPTRHLGAELTAGARLGERAELSGGYTFTRAALLNARRSPMPNQPAHAAHAQLVGELRAGRLARGRGAVGARWRGPITLDLLGRRVNPALLSLDARLEVDLPAGLRLTLRGDNLLDERRGQDGLQRPLPGRSLMMSLSFDTPQGDPSGGSP